VDWLFEDRKDQHVLEQINFALKCTISIIPFQLLHHYLKEMEGSYLKRVAFTATFSLSAMVLKYFMLKKHPIALRYGDFFLCFLLIIIIAEGEFFLFPHAPQVNPA
jgi:hypothetical protein